MYMEPTTWFGAARSRDVVPETNIPEGDSGVDQVARAIDGVLQVTLKRRKAGPMHGTREWHANAEVSRAVTGSGQEPEDLGPLMHVVPIGLSRAPTVALHPLQEWEGYVVEINQSEFTARLLDLTADASFEEEEADIPFAEISDADLDKIRLGSIFRWVIGYERSAVGTKKRVSQIVFRDLPAVTKSDMQAGEAWALKMAMAFRR